MRLYIKAPRRTELRVESLEGKTLLSIGSVMHHMPHDLTVAPIVAQATAEFSGTLTGSYSNVHAPGFANIVSYTTSGTLSGIGSTRLKGTFVVRGGTRQGRLLGEFLIRNNGGAMVANVYPSATRGIYTYSVIRARGIDTAFRGESAELMISQTPTFSVPFAVFGNATMTFSPG